MDSPHRPLCHYKTHEIYVRLKELKRLRTKSGYKKISEHKRRKLRQRIRWQIEMLRRALPRIEGITNPCDPETWDVRYPTERDRQESIALFTTISQLFGPHKW